MAGEGSPGMKPRQVLSSPCALAQPCFCAPEPCDTSGYLEAVPMSRFYDPSWLRILYSYKGV